MNKRYVICFYWEGDRWKSDTTKGLPWDPAYRNHLTRTGNVSLKLAAEYVNNLYAGVKRNTTYDFDFICFTNEKLEVNEGIELREFPMVTERGVLPRVYMFSPDAGLSGRQVLCLDLDVIIVGSIDPLLTYEGPFCARSKFVTGESWKLDGDIMSFPGNDETVNTFWKPFVADVDKAVEETKGRERYWIRRCAENTADRWEVVTPGLVTSYKWNVLKNIGMKNAAIVSCHGHPRPHQITVDWLHAHWVGLNNK